MGRVDKISPFWILLAWWPASGLLVWLAFTIYQLRFPPGCFGIGWGCSLEPYVWAAGAMVVALPTLILFAAGIGIWKWRLRSQNATSPLPSRVALLMPALILAVVALGVWGS